MQTLILAAALFIYSAPEANIDYVGDVACTPLPDHCAPTFCEEWELAEDGQSLVCLDSDELYGPGHWSLDIGPDQNDLQVTVEY